MPGDALAHPPLYAPREHFAPPAVAVPEYLERHYWWAYVRPNAVRVFERPWLVDLILWGNYRRLCDAALTALGCGADQNHDDEGRFGFHGARSNGLAPLLLHVRGYLSVR